MEVSDTRFWVCNVHTGDVIRELDVAGEWSLTNRFGGGTMSLKVPLGHLRTRDGSGVDWPAVERVHAVTEPGDYSILVTAGSVALGEWVITTATPHTDGFITVTGDEWEMYPAERSIAVSDQEKSGDMYELMRWVLTRVFVTSKVVPIAVDLPPGNAGVNKTLEIVARGGMYSDLISSLTDSIPQMEWRIEVSAVWDEAANKAMKSTRTAVFGRPTLARATSLVASYPGPGERSGNVLSLEQPRDWRAWTYQVAGIGAGNGEKRLWKLAESTYADFPVKLHRGIIQQFSEVTSPSWLQSLTDGALESMAWRSFAVTKMELHPLRFRERPRVGTKVYVEAPPTPAFPYGIGEDVRIGEVTYGGAGRIIDSLSVLAA